MRTIAFVLGISLLGPAAALAAEAALPGPVAKALKEQTDLCSEAGGKPSTTAALRRVDLNADGKEDFVLDVSSIQCQGAASIYGDREKAVQVFLADVTDGATPAFTDMVYGVKLEGTGASAKVWLTLAGAACGNQPAKFFSEETYCDRPLVWNATTKKVEYAPITAAKPIR